MQIITVLSYFAVAAAAADARVYSQKNLKGSHEDVHGYGCGNVGSSTFKVNSIHLRHSTFCYLYEKKNCKGPSFYVARDVNDLHLDTVNSVHCVNNPDKS
ncbi:Cyanate hydratase [Fusarium austroafricanum]|uniref:Cyanate hydratase n=1 Tax=Fusarium austroafricanum TaxID=2364996 RepID=A0A8H4NRE7_9HYPO|nr:Cyanate hydratase [Fusarium austroafricanum]